MRTVILDMTPDEQEDGQPWLLIVATTLLLLLAGGAIGYVVSQGGLPA